MRRTVYINNNCNFTTMPVIIVLGVLVAVCLLLSKAVIATVLLFLMIIFLIAYLDSHHGLKGMVAEIKADRMIIGVGDKAEIHCCMVKKEGPDSINTVIRIPVREEDPVDFCSSVDKKLLTLAEEDKGKMLGDRVKYVIEKKKVVMQKGETVKWTFPLQGTKRGLFLIADCQLCCGDMFGLSVADKIVSSDSHIIVTPSTICMDWEQFLPLNHLPEKENEPGRLDLLFDGESYNDPADGMEGLEETMRVFFSLINELWKNNIYFAIHFPETAISKAQVVSSTDDNALEKMCRACSCYWPDREADKDRDAGFSILMERSSFSSTILKAREEKLRNVRRRSVFDVSAMEETTRFIYFTYGDRIQPSNALQALKGKQGTLVMYYIDDDYEESTIFDFSNKITITEGKALQQGEEN